MVKVRPRKARARRDLLKVGFLLAALAAVPTFLAVMPGLFIPALLGLVGSLLFSPMIAWFERRNFSRGAAVGLVFGGAILLCLGATYGLGRAVFEERDQLADQGSAYLATSIERMNALEAKVKTEYPILNSVR